MFCVKCGNQMSDDAKFCTKCGALASGNQNYVTVQPGYNGAVQNGYSGDFDRGSVRRTEINEVRKMLSYFSQKTEQYNEYDYVCREFYRLKGGRRIAAVAWGYILAIGGSILAVYLIGGAVIELIKGKPESAGTSFILGILAAFFLALPGVLLILLDKKKIRKEYNEQLAYYTDKYFGLSNELYNHYLNYKNCPIGPEYTNPANIQVILDTIISGRADTTKEALNVLVEDAHRNRMEDLAAQTAQFAQEAARQAGRAASASQIGAVFSAANYFQVRDFIRR